MDYKKMSEFDESTSTDSMEIIGLQDSKNVRISIENLLSAISSTITALETRVSYLEEIYSATETESEYAVTLKVVDESGEEISDATIYYELQEA